MNILKCRQIIIIAGLTVLTCKSGRDYPSLDLSKFHDGIHHWNLFHDQSKYKRYPEDKITEIASNLIQYQNDDGGWPKNIDWLAVLDIDSLKESLSERDKQSTLDNNNVFPQIEYLSKVFQLTGDICYKNSALKGLRYLLNVQNKSGGWRGWDVDAITFNDQVMTGVMHLFLDIVERNDHFNWISNPLSDSVNEALQRAIDVTLRCQVKVKGRLTGWCQQHDHETLQPVMARSYELPSITARESVDIVRLLIRIPNPDTDIILSIKSAIHWLDSSRIYGIKLEKILLNTSEIINDEYPYDLVVVQDSTAESIWSRFYDINTNKPFLCRRDGTIVYSLDEISPERRTGYEWYGYWPEELIEKEYPEWLKKNNLSDN